MKTLTPSIIGRKQKRIPFPEISGSRFFEPLFGPWPPLPGWPELALPGIWHNGDIDFWKTAVPAADISEDEKEIKIELDVPGYDPETIKIELDLDRLTVEGSMAMEREEKEKRYFCRERQSGSFFREFALPASADPDQAKSVLKNGTLTITIPKKPGRKHTTLPITRK